MQIDAFVSLPNEKHLEFAIRSKAQQRQQDLFIYQKGNFNRQSNFISRSISPLDENEKENVNVNLVPDVDSFTLTAVGFGLIAFNFFVFANMGDAGIGGLVARIINAFS